MKLIPFAVAALLTSGMAVWIVLAMAAVGADLQ